MVKIRLYCAAGMSTSFLVTKMKAAAEKKGVEADIEALPESSLSGTLDGVDAALLGPQIGYALPKVKKICDEKGVPVEVIPMVDYGRMNGENVLALALKLAGKL